jgi:hypothetical protein
MWSVDGDTPFYASTEWCLHYDFMLVLLGVSDCTATLDEQYFKQLGTDDLRTEQLFTPARASLRHSNALNRSR